MSVMVNCPDCQARVSVPETLLGRQVKCTKCQAVFVVERPRGDAAPPAQHVERQDRPRTRHDNDEYDERQMRRRRRSRERARRREPEYEGEYEDEPGYGAGFLAPHRGATIQSMGMVSIMLCCIPLVGLGVGLGAIAMARNDLLAIDSGKMEPSGRGATQTGQVCGYIGCGLSVLCMILFCIVSLGGRK